MTRVVVVFDESESLEALEWLLQGSGFTVVDASEDPPVVVPPEDRGVGPGSDHQARELLHRVAMLGCVLQLPTVTDAERRRWSADIADANRRLDALYDAGLSRDFVGAATPSHRPPVGGFA